MARYGKIQEAPGYASNKTMKCLSSIKNPTDDPDI
jgi:hypothetical protein